MRPIQSKLLKLQADLSKVKRARKRQQLAFEDKDFEPLLHGVTSELWKNYSHLDSDQLNVILREIKSITSPKAWLANYNKTRGNTEEFRVVEDTVSRLLSLCGSP